LDLLPQLSNCFLLWSAYWNIGIVCNSQFLNVHIALKSLLMLLYWHLVQLWPMWYPLGIARPIAPYVAPGIPRASSRLQVWSVPTLSSNEHDFGRFQQVSHTCGWYLWITYASLPHPTPLKVMPVML
jgi:hypothetical protein